MRINKKNNPFSVFSMAFFYFHLCLIFLKSNSKGIRKTKNVRLLQILDFASCCKKYASFSFQLSLLHNNRLNAGISGIPNLRKVYLFRRKTNNSKLCKVKYSATTATVRTMAEGQNELEGPLLTQPFSNGGQINARILSIYLESPLPPSSA